jgi:uncharacterized protein
MSDSEVVYLDSSAIVKLVVVEAESQRLREFLADYPVSVSCSLARTEVVRAVRDIGFAAVQRARAVLATLDLVNLDDALLDDAAVLQPLVLRSLDAIHLCAARLLGSDLHALVTYDQRMASAASGLGLPTAAPA